MRLLTPCTPADSLPAARGGSTKECRAPRGNRLSPTLREMTRMIVRRFAGAIALASLLVCGLARAETLGPNLLRNGGFESGDGLEDWHWATGEPELTGWSADSEVRHEGQRSLRIHSALELQPHRFCGLARTVDGITAGSEYVLTLWARGKGVGVCWFGGGPEWATRQFLPTGDFDWTPFEVGWRAPDPAVAFELHLNVDSATEALWIDDVSFREVDPLGLRPRVEAVPLSGAANAGFLRMARVEGPLAVDGDLSDWPGDASATRMPRDAGLVVMDRAGDDDLSATLATAFDSRGLYLGITVRDDIHSAVPGAPAWTNDSIQVAIDPLRERTRGGYGPRDSEYSLMLADDGDTEVRCWQRPQTVGDQSEAIDLAVRRSGSETVYEAAFPWSAIGAQGPSLGLDVLVNDNDGAGRKGYIELTWGIGKVKDPSAFVTAIGWGPCLVSVRPGTPTAHADGPLDLTAVVVLGAALAGEATLELAARNAAGVATSLTSAPLAAGSEGIYRATCRLPAGLLPVDTTEIGVEVVADGGRSLAVGATPLSVGPARAEVAAEVERLRARTAEVASLAEEAEARGIATDYERVAITAAEMFVGFAREDLDNGLRERAVHVLAVLDGALEEAAGKLRDYLAGRAKPLLVPLYQTGKVEVRDGAFWGETLVPSTGKRERRPVFFTGYNGWDNTVRDMPQLAQMGMNFLQNECGPDSTQPSEGVVTGDPVRARMGRTLSLGEQYNVSVCWLAAPHYFPDWALQKWPELLRGSGGFFRLNPEAPEARQILDTHLRVSLEAMGDSPALHSVCLSNEPIFTNWQNDPHRRAEFTEHLAARFGSIEALNAAWGTGYPSFAEVPILATDGLPSEEGMTPLRYEMARFNMLRFSEFHRAMSDVVHEARPGMWTHAKVMCVPAGRQNLAWGTGPEQFSLMGDLSGNDCYCMFAGLGDRFAVDYQWQGIYYDLQRSMRDVPVVNTEDHIIVDREQRDIPPEHTDLALWQGAIHGRGASAIWVWGRTFDPKSDLAGSIMHRPENTMAASRVALDLQRLAPEVVALQRARAPVAIVYSTTSLLWSDHAQDAVIRSYEALNACGLPVRFVSEKQAANGALGRFRAVIAPSLGHAPDSLAGALADYCAAGGRLWVVGTSEPCAHDEYGRPREYSLPAGATVRFPSGAEGRELQGLLIAEMARAGIAPAVVTTNPDGTAPWGVEVRSVRHGESMLVAVANLWGTPRTVRLSLHGQPVASIEDLRRATTSAGPELTLAPLEATVLRVR